MKAPSMKKIPSKMNRKESNEIKMNDNSYNPQPSLSIGEDILPEIKSWKVKGEYELHIKVKMTGVHESEYGNDKGKVKGDFKITSIGLGNT